MPTLPPDTKNLAGRTEYGVDDNGAYVYFGFKFEASNPEHFTTNYLELGNIINYLVAIAREAQQRRLKIDPTAQHLEVKGIPSNPVRQLDVDPDVTGQFAVWQCTMQDGTRLEAQIPFDIMEGLVAALPPRIDEMKKRQAERKQPN